MKNQYYVFKWRMFIMAFLSLVSFSVLAAEPIPYTPSFQAQGSGGRVNTKISTTGYDYPSDNYEFVLEQKEGSGPWTQVATDGPFSPLQSGFTSNPYHDVSFVLGSLTDGSSYLWRVKIRNISGSSSESVYSTTPNTTVFSAFMGTVTISENWSSDSRTNIHVVNGTTGGTGFDLKYTANGVTMVKSISAGFMETDILLTDLMPNTVYSIEGIMNGSGNIIASNSIGVKTNRAAPPTPSFFEVVSACPESITVQARFDDPSSFDTYQIVVGAGDIQGYGYAGSSITQNIIVNPGQTVTVKIITENETGRTSSNLIIYTAPVYEPPIPSYALNAPEASLTEDGFTVNWQNGMEDWTCLNRIRDDLAIAYTIIHQDKSVEVVDQIPLFKNTITYDVTGVGAKSWVGVVIYAANHTYGQVVKSDTLWVKTLGPPDAPIDLEAKGRVDVLGENEILLSWTDIADDEDAQTIEVKEGEGDFKFLSHTVKDLDWFVHKPIKTGVKYTYRIKGNNKYGYGPYSEELEYTYGTAAAATETAAVVSVYPNPTVDGVNMKIGSISTTADVSLVDQNNRKILVKQVKLIDGEGRLDMYNIRPGAYQLLIKTGTEQVSRKIYKY